MRNCCNRCCNCGCNNYARYGNSYGYGFNNIWSLWPLLFLL
ncbi:MULTISPECIES: hypothetical protein [Clostridium]|nr:MULTISPECIES: hypothetical protein [Clostridium]